MRRVAVVGAGAAGLMAAAACAEAGADVCVFEKNEKAGKKIYITGKGRCNVTNACDMTVFFENIISNPKFMYKSVHAFDSRALMTFIEDNGTPLKVERGERVFPVSDHASDITKALILFLEKHKVKLKYNKRVEAIKVYGEDKEKRVKSLVISGRETDDLDAVILACGGATYPGAGGCEDGYRLCRSLGINLIDIRPGLVPFLLKEDYIKDMQGLSLKNVKLNIYNGAGKKIFSGFGEMLFTHFGMSGPLVLTASSVTGDILAAEKILRADIDLKPALSEQELDKRLLRDIEEKKKKNVSSFFEGLLPKSMHGVMINLWGISPQKKVSSINSSERKEIAKLIKAFPVTVTGTRGFNEAIITRGGVSVKELNPSTMESKLIKDLYICGEMVDVDALTGGFNLQCAFSMGHAAGLAAAKGE